MKLYETSTAPRSTKKTQTLKQTYLNNHSGEQLCRRRLRHSARDNDCGNNSSDRSGSGCMGGQSCVVVVVRVNRRGNVRNRNRHRMSGSRGGRSGRRSVRLDGLVLMQMLPIDEGGLLVGFVCERAVGLVVAHLVDSTGLSKSQTQSDSASTEHKATEHKRRERPQGRNTVEPRFGLKGEKKMTRLHVLVFV